VISAHIGDLFDWSIVLYSLLFTDNPAQARLLLEHCSFKIFRYAQRNLDTCVENGSWERISNSKAFEAVYVAHMSQFDMTQDFNLFSVLVLDLWERVLAIDNGLKNISKVKIRSDKPRHQEFRKLIHSLKMTSLHNATVFNLVNQYLEESNENSEFSSENTMVCLAEEHDEWSQYRLPLAMRVECTFEPPADASELTFHVQYKSGNDGE